MTSRLHSITKFKLVIVSINATSHIHVLNIVYSCRVAIINMASGDTDSE